MEAINVESVPLSTLLQMAESGRFSLTCPGCVPLAQDPILPLSPSQRAVRLLSYRGQSVAGFLVCSL